MADRIVIEDLLVRCVLGLSAEERRARQEVHIRLVLEVDLRPAGASDRVEDSVNYRDVKKRVFSFAESSSYHLAEALAEHIAALCLETPRVRRVEVRVEKPSALRFARSVGVEITRSRT